MPNNSLLFLSFSTAFLFDHFIGSKFRININVAAVEFTSLLAGDHRFCNFYFLCIPRPLPPFSWNLEIRNSSSSITYSILEKTYTNSERKFLFELIDNSIAFLVLASAIMFYIFRISLYQDYLILHYNIFISELWQSDNQVTDFFFWLLLKTLS